MYLYLYLQTYRYLYLYLYLAIELSNGKCAVALLSEASSLRPLSAAAY